MTEPLKWALLDLLRLLNSDPGASHEKLEGIAATLGVDIHHSRGVPVERGGPGGYQGSSGATSFGELVTVGEGGAKGAAGPMKQRATRG